MFATGSNNIFDANSGFKAHWTKEKEEKKKKEPIVAVKKRCNRCTFYDLNKTL